MYLHVEHPRKRTRPKALVALVLTSVAAIPSGMAVQLNADGMGQALIFPYYTARSVEGNAFNTYFTIVNHTTDAKAVRVRVREGRNSREVASFNLFLSSRDAWAGAISPDTTGPGARLAALDRSCVAGATGPLDMSGGLPFSNASFTGSAADGNGEGLDRTREGWIEVIEMATLTGASAAAVTHNSGGVPANCSGVQGAAAVSVAAPTGGLSGTLTLINVMSGRDFTLAAEALADLSAQTFYRPASDPYPDFNAAEVDPTSVVVANGFVYRSRWTRGADAVSATLMRSSWAGEFVLDEATRSRTDFVATYPTRQYYFPGGVALAPFSADCRFGGSADDTFAGESVRIMVANREEASIEVGSTGLFPFPTAPNYRCGASTAVFDFRNGRPHTAPTPESHVFGSQNRALPLASMPAMPPETPNGWLMVTPLAGRTRPGLTSLATSTRIDIGTGVTTTGTHVFAGLPVVGFTARTFDNGTLACSMGACKGNYGGAWPLSFQRAITLGN